MKKFLIGTTALVAAGFIAGQAQAADPIKLSVGGYMEQWVGFVDQDEDLTGGAVAATDQFRDKYVDVLNQADTELYFTGSTKLDNGLTVAATIQIEGDRGATGQDDVTLRVTSDTLGSVTLGATKGLYGFGHAAPDVGISLNDGDVENWIDSGHIGNATATPTATNSATLSTLTSLQDGQGVVYTTPSFGGLTLGASYSSNTAAAPTGEVNLSLGNGLMYDFGATFSGEFGGVTVGADVISQFTEAGGSTGTNTHEVRGGLSLGVAGFTIGGSVSNLENEDPSTAAGTVAEIDGWDIGVAYATGPYAVSLSYLSSEADIVGVANDDTKEAWMLSGSYNLGAGVVAKASVFEADFDDGNTNTANSAADNKGFGVVAGLRVDF